MGFWERNVQRYVHNEKAILLIKRQMMRFNYENDIDNSKNIIGYNQYILGQTIIFGGYGNEKYLKSDAFNFSVMDIIETSKQDIFTIKGLTPVFMLYGVGMILSSCVFLIEIFYHYVRK